MCSVCGGRRAAGASPIRCVGERITATGVPEFREVAWRAWDQRIALPAYQGLKIITPLRLRFPDFKRKVPSAQ
ncbi:hypothetical protein [Bathymodiolus japonicus methanotrophic gill symbiont]|uniref:hypothetical protein n=1 Tax=Bathymodiolus japonicus methanotrophic gill symbiont TaxID=113269 RepID=UPI001C8E1DD6|nr:hypothetical protein [Bathymodiolus japonicus methanotrophic gill symbiont]